MANETRSSIALVRVTPSVKALAEKVAKADNLSLSSLIEKALIDHLKSKGYLRDSKSGSIPTEDLNASNDE